MPDPQADQEAAPALQVPEGITDLEAQLAWVREGEDYDEKSQRADALYKARVQDGTEPDEEANAALSAQLQAAVYGDQAPAEGSEGAQGPLPGSQEAATGAEVTGDEGHGGAPDDDQAVDVAQPPGEGPAEGTQDPADVGDGPQN